LKTKKWALAEYARARTKEEEGEKLSFEHE